MRGHDSPQVYYYTSRTCSRYKYYKNCPKAIS